MTGEAQNKPEAFVLVGLPCSGKSTWAQKHPRRLPVASTDSYIEAHAAENGLSYGDAFFVFHKKAQALMKKQVESYIASSTSFIWDQTNLTPRERRGIYNNLHASHRVEFICFLVPLDICLQRYEVRTRNRDGGNAVNAERIRELARTATFPDKGEHFDKIVRLRHPAWPKECLDYSWQTQPPEE